MTGSRDVFEFEGFRLDLRRMGLWRADQRIALEPRALDVLRHLVVNRDRLVTKDELLDAVWKDTFVTPNALTRAVAQLRKSLRDDVASPKLIETVAKRGYRFVAPVTIVDHESAEPSPSLPHPTIGTIDPHAPAGGRIGVGVAAAYAAVTVALLIALAFGWRVAASREARRIATPLDITALTSYGDVIDAIISPDAKYLAFVRSDQGRQSLWVRQLRGTNPIQLVAAQPVSYYGMSFAPDSASLYYVVRGPEPLAYPSGMLFQIPALGGAPRRLGAVFDHYPAVSPDGTTLASLRADYPAAGESALITARADGSGLRTLMAVREPNVLAPGFFVAPAWSPTGDRIAAVIRNADTRSARLTTVDVATGNVHPFATAFASAAFASWMPDGSGIVFTGASPRKPSSEFGLDLWFQPLPDGTPHPITTGVVEYRNVTVSANGSSLVSVGGLQNAALWRLPIERSGHVEKIPSQKEDGLGGLAWLDADTIVLTSFDGGTPQIWTMAADGSGRHQITMDGANFSPRPTRDGRTIYFVSFRQGRSGIWQMNRDGSNARQVATVPELWNLVLTPDERHLLFTAPGPARLDSTWTVSTDGGVPSLAVAGLTQAAVSADGQSVAGLWQERQSAQPALAVFPIAGGRPTSVFTTVAPMLNGGVWWSRDGRVLFYTSTDRVNVWRQPLNGGAPTTITDLGDGMITRGDLSPDGRTLLAVRAHPVRDAFLITGFR